MSASAAQGRRPTGDLLIDHRRQRGEGICDEVW